MRSPIAAKLATNRNGATSSILWPAAIADALAILTIGLTIVPPSLGYATWHLYTRPVER